jgi:hypothetical protein
VSIHFVVPSSYTDNVVPTLDHAKLLQFRIEVGLQLRPKLRDTDPKVHKIMPATLNPMGLW